MFAKRIIFWLIHQRIKSLNIFCYSIMLEIEIGKLSVSCFEEVGTSALSCCLAALSPVFRQQTRWPGMILPMYPWQSRARSTTLAMIIPRNTSPNDRGRGVIEDEWGSPTHTHRNKKYCNLPRYIMEVYFVFRQHKNKHTYDTKNAKKIKWA